MNELTEHKIEDKRLVNLYNERERILSMPPEKALDAILESPQALPLVHSFPEEDLYLLINDIGIDDSLPLLNLATTKQWEFIFDIEIWEKDRIKISPVTRWFERMITADSKRFINWILNEKIEFCEYYLYKNIEVFVREHDQDPSVFGDECFTFYDIYYIRFIDQPADKQSQTDVKKESRRAVITRFLELIAADNHVTFQNILYETSGIIPAESEEEAFRLRNVRLSEKGFLPFYEASGIYQPMKPEDFNLSDLKIINKNAEISELLPVSVYPSGMLKEDNLFTRSLMTIELDYVLHQIQIEFARLCNQIISADQIPIKEKPELKLIVKKACSYLSIGIQRLTRDEKKSAKDSPAVLIQKYQLNQIFRLGFGAVLEQKWRADKWIAKSWFKENGLPLTFWDEFWTGVLGGIFLKKPLFYDNYKTGVLYREFETLEEIAKTEKELDQIISFDNLFSLMLIDFKDSKKLSSDIFLTYKNVLLTLWARHHLGLSDTLEPVGLDEIKRFFNYLFGGVSISENQNTYETANSGIISNSIKESFLDWLSTKTDLAGFEITDQIGETLESLFIEIENEYGSIAVNDIDPKYIHHFILEPKCLK